MTQGIISLVDKEGRVLRKVVSGCDGQEAKNVASLLEKMKGPIELEKIYDVVFEHMGCEQSLVIQGPDGEFFDEDEIFELPAAYREKFSDPRWNPRWARGTAEHTVVVTVDWSEE